MLVICIQWNGGLSQPIKISKGTRQGGLSSPFIFNTFYQEMIANLSTMSAGVKIRSKSYSVFCYADDVLLLSVTPKGLQNLIDAADNYVSQNGLGFNSLKSVCVTHGKSKLGTSKWNIKGEPIVQLKEVNYLGITLSSNNSSHSLERAKAGRAAFYSLYRALVYVKTAYQ